MRQVRKEGGDDRKMCDGFRGHGGERVPARLAGGDQVRAAVSTEVARRHHHLAMWAGHERRSFERPRPSLACSASGTLAAVGSPLAHAPPPLMYRIHAASSAAPSMLPQPVAKSHPMPASKARLLPLVTSWKGLAGNREELSPIQ